MADAVPTTPPVAIQLLEPTSLWQGLTWAGTITTLLTFTTVAVILTRRYLQRTTMDTEAFLTARGTQAWPRIAWSFFAGALGAWAIATPANMAATGGVIGLVSYAVSTAIPVILVSFAGEKITQALPRPLSLSDFVLWRYGRVAQIFVAIICLLNMSLFVISEFSTMGSIMESFVKSSQYPIIVIVGLLTAGYTAYGGLLISIVTDQMQGIFSMVLFVVLALYLAIGFRPDLPPFPSETLGATEYGWTTLFTLPCSLIASTFFSEANWQRVWAAESKTALRKGALGGALLIVTVMTLFGLAGLLAMWAYAPSLDAQPQYANLLLFYSLGHDQYTWIGALMVMLAVTMNQGAVDSIQNAITATISANLFRTKSLTAVRVAVLVINIPLMVIGFFTLPALNLFLITNLLTTGTFIPLLSGLADINRRYVSGYAMMFASVAAAVSLTVYGWIRESEFGAGFIWAWWGNGYDLYAFLVPLVASIVGLIVWVGCAEVLYRVAGIQGQEYSAEMKSVLDRMQAMPVGAASAETVVGAAGEDETKKVEA
ncbi:hypothetical protein GGF31_001695 [Allomyces arbusculus]|nr:hypothetical protein GGF31_001695 [Allomyces arbusculus]